MPQEVLRPSMRRKSSAQNLLSSFKTSTGPTISTNLPPALQSNAVGTPTTARASEWDVQSSSTHHSGDSGTTLTVGAQPTSAGASPAMQGTTVEYLREIVQKRIITLTYMRNVHEGRSHWFHTIMMSRADLDRVFNNTAMKRRTYRFAILGMSLSNLLDIHQPQDLLRGMLGTLTEYDQWKEESDKPKMRLFRSKIAKRQAGGGLMDYNIPYTDSSETSYLITPHMPFPLDYHQTLLSLLDVLSESYNKLSKLLGPSPFPHSAHSHMHGPLGTLAPHPGVSYLFSEAPNSSAQAQTGHAPTSADGSLWGIANAGLPANGPGSAMGMGMAGGVSAGTAPWVGGFAGPLGSPPPSWAPAMGESVLKIDAKFKKITTTLLKELDAFARNGIKDELASLDPLLRNVAVTDDGREQYDFEGTV
ncbi:hypothetical protein PLICRDRAFT_110017 [Plicaturopsis crispa FD-325 SS-3]|nr:hypothetical protein PLICRDRAFT_110017 [Plicaturopsis crispa FD-325 SS-3]